MPNHEEYTADVYIYLVMDYLEMGLKKDAVRTVLQGVARYPGNPRLLELMAEMGVSDERG